MPNSINTGLFPFYDFLVKIVTKKGKVEARYGMTREGRFILFEALVDLATPVRDM